MQPSHERYCDRGHTLRQPYNAALAPVEMRAATPTESPSVLHETAPTVEPAPDEEPASSAIREAVAESDAPQPTVYVLRAWERTAAAVGPRETEAVDRDERTSGGGVRRIAMVAVAIAVVLVTARGVRGRRGGRV